MTESWQREFAELLEAKRELACLRAEICQVLGRALGYPPYARRISPAPEGTGDVYVGDHTAESLAAEATAEIARLRAALAAREPAL